GHWCGRSGDKSGTGDVGSGGDNEQSARGFTARLAGGGEEAPPRQSGKQQDGKEAAGHQPAPKHQGRSRRARGQKIVQPKVADRFDHAGEDETKGQDQCNAVVRAAETHQRVGRIAETQQRTADFEEKISRGASEDVRLAGVEHGAKIDCPKDDVSNGVKVVAPLAEETRDLPPNAQNSPQLPGKPGESLK